MRYLDVRQQETVCVHIAHGDEAACIPGTIDEVKEHTGIIVCKFFIGGKLYVESFRREDGVSVRGKHWGYITPISCEAEHALIEHLEKARIAWKSDERKIFATIREQILCTVMPGVKGLAHARSLAGIEQLLHFFCKADKIDPGKIAQAIVACVKSKDPMEVASEVIARMKKQ